MYQVRIEADSINPFADRLMTFVIEFPRTVLAEAVTHRLNSDSWGDDIAFCERTTTPDISKNSASSRAIPHARFVEKIRDDPYLPAFTGKARGMQGSYLDPAAAARATAEWLGARDDMLRRAGNLDALGVHKQDSNRLLEPFAWVTQVVTSSRWDNFFALRCHADAHPALRKVARMMFLARRKSTPRRLVHGEWHLPFSGGEPVVWEPPGPAADPFALPPGLLRSVARCAWVSYENHDRVATDDAVRGTVERLLVSRPLHSSPAEHQATPFRDDVQARYYRSNLAGYLQLRKLLPAERCDRYEPADEEVRAWPEFEAHA